MVTVTQESVSYQVRPESARLLGDVILNMHKYVDRRTVTVSYPATRDIIRKTTLDGQLPARRNLPIIGHAADGAPLVPFPIGFGHRGRHLVGFSLTHNQIPASLMSRRENEEMVIAAIEAKLPQSLLTEGVSRCFRELATSSTGKEGNFARDGLVKELHRADQVTAKTLLYAEGRHLSWFGQTLVTLATNYVMFARVPDTGGRFLLNYTAQFPHADNPTHQDVSGSHPSALLSDLAKRTLFQWPQLSIDFSEAAQAQSAHLELCFPEGVTPVDPHEDGRWTRGPALITTEPPAARAGKPSRPKLLARVWLSVRSCIAEQEDGNIPNGEVSRTFPGERAGPRIHFASTSDRAVPIGASVSVPVRPAKGGWLAATLFLTSLAALTAVAALRLLTDEAPAGGPPLTPEHVNSIIAALVSVGSLTAAKRDTHELVNRVQQSYRAALVVMSMTLLVAAIAGPAFTDDGQVAWTVAAVVSLTFLVLQVLGWLTRRTRLTECMLRIGALAATTLLLRWLWNEANILSGVTAWLTALVAASVALTSLTAAYAAFQKRRAATVHPAGQQRSTVTTM